MTRLLSIAAGGCLINISSILPGHTNTPAAEGNVAGDLGVNLLAGTSLCRFGEPEGIAPVAIFLASQDSHRVTRGPD